MPAPNSSLKQSLTKSSEINISVIGRKSGRNISQTVWFVFEDEKIYLLPVRGTDTQWYKNALANPSIRIEVRSQEAEFKASPVADQKQVSEVVRKFRSKYGDGDVKKYYTKFDVAVIAQPR